MNVSLLIGGISLFIYSIDMLSNNLTKLSINKIKDKLKKLTSNLHSSLLTGFVSTAIIQSSSALIMITISLINANLLTFNDGVGIVLGSNVATTITSFLIGINLEKFASLIMLISLLGLNFKNDKINKTSKITFIVSLLFFSIHIISISTLGLENDPRIYTYINSVADNFALSILVGTLFTCALQSSSVFIAIIQILAMSGFISLHQAIPLVFGANIGTSFDPLLTLFSGNKESKKLAHFSIFFNISTVIIFAILIVPFELILDAIVKVFNANIAINIAIINILFNVLGIIVILPFLKQIKKYYAKW